MRPSALAATTAGRGGRLPRLASSNNPANITDHPSARSGETSTPRLVNPLTDRSHGAAFLALGLYSTNSRIVLLP